MMMALGVLSALCVALLGVSIAALVDAKDAQSSVSRLEDSLSTGASSSGVLSSGLAGSTAVSMPPGVYVSTDPTPPTGYLAAGSIYRGSGGRQLGSGQGKQREHLAALMQKMPRL